MISSLKLTHWKSHEESTVGFGRGSNLFVGQMGSGKTSVLEGVCFALFGTFPNLKNHKLSLEDVVMKQPKAYNDAEAVLEFGAGGKNYTVTRIVRLGKDGKGSTEAFLRENGKLVEGPQTQRVTEAVQSALKVDFELFSRTAYAEQNRIDYFVALPKAERKRQADELLGIDKFEACRANCVSAANKLRGLEAEAKSFLAGADGALLQGEFDEAEKSAAAIESGLAGLREKLRGSEAERDAARSGLDALEKTRSEVESLKRNVAAASAVVSDGSRELGEKKAAAARLSGELGVPVEGAKGSLENAASALARKNDELSQLQNSAGEAQAGAKNAAARLEELRRKSSERALLLKRKSEALAEFPNGIANAIAHASDELEKAQATANAVDAELISVNSAMGTLGVARADCPVCGSPLTEEHKRNLEAEKAQALQKLRESKTLQAKLVSGCKAALRELEEKRLALSRTEERLSELLNADSEFEAAKLSLAREEERKKQLEERTEKLRQELRGMEGEVSKKRELAAAAAEISRLNEKISAARAQAEISEKKLSSIAFSQGALDAKRKGLEALLSAISEIAATEKAHAASLAEKRAFLKTASQKLEAVRRKEGEARGLAQNAEAMQIFQNAVVDTQAELRETLVGAVNEALESTWQMLYPYADYSSLRLNAAEDYSLELQTLGGTWTSIENASGGERSCASLSLRIAFAMVLTPNLSWLVLDEPTHNLDSEAVQKLVMALHDEIPKIFEQVFIITHDEALKEGASAKIYRVQRDKERGGESVVEEIPLGEDE
ncbi:MAG: SMC family ATPase [Candidatus Micrarchaeia archaeon]|jgi:exonuclease SbcC